MNYHETRIDTLVGQRFGKLVVEQRTETPITVKNKNHSRYWLCRCDCGSNSVVTTDALRRGNSKSCGCGDHPNLVGQRFGKIVVTAEAPRKEGYIYWVCQCDCGKQTTVRTASLRKGETKSCGCNHFHLPPGEAGRNHVLYRYRYAAKKRNRVWKLSVEQATALLTGSCHYCGLPPSQKSGGTKRCPFRGVFYYNGIDRKDNNKGYIENNVVSCCKQCNFFKGTLPYVEFVDWIKRVVTWRQQQT